jgi:hypothetical protein
MTKDKFRNIIIAILFGIGFSFFACTQYLGVWSTSFEKGVLLLAGGMILVSLLFFLLIEFIYKKRKIEASSKPFSFLLLVIVSLTGILLLIFPLPERITPDAVQIVVIKPVIDKSHSSNANKILVEEIKINGNPVVLKDIKPSSGWITTPYGLESEPGGTVPIVLNNQGDMQSDISVLFGKGPAYGSAQVRFAWQLQQIDLYQPESESELFISIPKAPSKLWKFGFFLSYWITLSGILFILTLMIISEHILGLLPETISRLGGSIFFWIVISILFWYGFSFARMVFFNPTHYMSNENFLPAIRPIGNDLDLILNASKSVAAGGSPYAGANKYPPAATVLFLPLIKFHFLTAFQIITGITYIFFCFITLGLPYFLSKGKSLPAFAWLVFGFGLFSYGLLFEIERGQFNLIAMGLAFLAIVIFHKVPRLRWMAYIVFCFSIQLKIYPAIFILFFIDDWKDWKRMLIRWTSLGLANIALLFILGPGIFQKYFNSLTRVVSGIGKSNEPLNHSVNGLLTFANSYLNFSDNTFTIIQLILTFTIIGLIGLCLFISYSRRSILDPFLLLACTLGALLLPTLSNDYTLAYLVGPAIYLFIHLDEKSNEISAKEKKGDFSTVILFGISAFALTGTYFSYLQKPILIQNQFPALLSLLVCTAILSFKEFKTNLQSHKLNHDA